MVVYRVLEVRKGDDGYTEHVVDTDTMPWIAFEVARAWTQLTARLHIVRVPSGELLLNPTAPCEVASKFDDEPSPCGLRSVGFCFDDISNDTVPICTIHMQQLYPGVPVSENAASDA